MSGCFFSETRCISNAEHIKQTLSTDDKPYRHQQHLPKVSQNVSGAVRMAIRFRYGRNTCPNIFQPKLWVQSNANDGGVIFPIL